MLLDWVIVAVAILSHLNIAYVLKFNIVIAPRTIYMNKVMSASAAMLRNVAAPTMLSTSGTRLSFFTPNISMVGVHA